MTIEISESVVEAALTAVREVAIPHVTSFGEDGSPIAIECDVDAVGREAMRAALQAALAEMLEPVGYCHDTPNRVVVHKTQLTPDSIPIYRLKGQ